MRFKELKDGHFFRFEGTFYKKCSPRFEGLSFRDYTFNARSMYNMEYLTFVEDTVVEPYKEEK